MSKHIHGFKMVTECGGTIKRIYMDGEELKGIKEAFIHLTVGDLPQVWLATDVVTADVEIDFPEAKIILKNNKTEDDDKWQCLI